MTFQRPDQRVRFIRLDAYEAEGGTVRRGLFAEGENGRHGICDPALLQRLVAAKLEAEGWKWIAIELNANHQFFAQFRGMAPTPVSMSAATLKLAKLEEKAAQFQQEINAQEDDNVRGLIA